LRTSEDRTGAAAATHGNSDPEVPVSSVPTATRAWRATRPYRPVIVLSVALIVYFTITQSSFGTWDNIKAMLSGSSVLWILAVGMTFAMISGGVDLSVSALAALAGVLLSKLLGLGIPGLPAVIVTVLFGGVVGAFLNGFSIARLRLSFLVVTLATMTAMTGVVALWTHETSASVSSPILTDIAQKTILGLPTPIWLMAVVFVIALYVQRFTQLGRNIYAVGGSEVAARLSGVRTERALMITYGIVGLSAGLAGVLLVARIGATSTSPELYTPLLAIAAVALGGTSLAGGAGTVVGTAFGVIFIGVLQNGLSIAGVPAGWTEVVTGVILFLAVLGDRVELKPGSLRALLGAVRPGDRLAHAEGDIALEEPAAKARE
jgi:ribose transport system permease protein